MDKIFDFGTMVFNNAMMKERLNAETYKALQETVGGGAALSPQAADAVAAVMKDWALEKGATHFCHWFTPMTGNTSEKHEAFLSLDASGAPIARFSGKSLQKGESDASSFPSGGLRATSEARGYTAWDCTSPAFVKENTLYIPTAFCSYHGDALDTKTPLLRSMEALNASGVRFMHALGHNEVKRVDVFVGAEQEYFLVDKQYYDKRMDLMLTGRTLIGKLPPKGQELEDHYFGNLKPRVLAFMRELDRELWALGVPARTEHNETAPAQHELAPIFSVANIAADGNYLTMEMMKKVAARHGLVCLLHEKPFKGFNGSGKHNNWSLHTDTGLNLMRPGGDPRGNIPFLLTLAAVIQAVDKYPELLRMAAASPGNDHRLGSQEAPPAIVSVYLGDGINLLLEQIRLDDFSPAVFKSLKLEVKTLPEFKLDNSDRNRTSPFAYTGNKFEFRMLGSSASIAAGNTYLNAMVAESLDTISARLEKSEDITAEAYSIIKEITAAHGRVIFNGNNYSSEWVEEAARRGLANITNAVDAYAAFKDKKNIELLTSKKVFSKAELDSRYEIFTDAYVKTVNIEALTLAEIAGLTILPAARKYAGHLGNILAQLAFSSLKNAGLSEDIKLLNAKCESLHRAVTGLKKATIAASKHSALIKRAEAFRDKVIPAMDAVRESCDELESLIAAEFWPLPTYFDLLYRA